MIVTLTWDQWKAIRTRIPIELAEAMLAHRRARGRSHDYLLPAIGWKRVLDALVAECYGPLGGMKAGGRNASVYRAISKIAERVGRMESHPALTPGLGVTGPSADVIPAWVVEQGFGYSPYPVADASFVVLRPHMIRLGRADITIWKSGDPDPANMLENPAFHILLSGAAELSG